MDYYNIISGAIAGAITGGFIGYFGIKAKQSDRFAKFKRVGLVVGVVLFPLVNGIANIPEVKSSIMSKFDSNYAFKMYLSKRMGSILTIPEVKSKLESFKTEQEANLYARKLVHNGLKRLSWTDLKKWNKARLALSMKSPEMCAGFWNGKISDDLLFSTMSQLSKETVEDWVTVSTAAARLEVAKSDYAQLSTEDFGYGIKVSADSMSHENQVKMQTILAQGVNATPEDGCWMMKILLKTESLLDQEKGEKFVRYMANF